MKFSIIAAVDKKYGIGKNNRLPWRLPSDLAYFSRVTIGGGKNAVIMGRQTFGSLPEAHRPLANRLNIIVSSSKLELPAGVRHAHSLDEALEVATAHSAQETFVIGGAALYATAISHPACEKIYLTEIDAIFECDAFFPHFDVDDTFKKAASSEWHTENAHTFRFSSYVRHH